MTCSLQSDVSTAASQQEVPGSNPAGWDERQKYMLPVPSQDTPLQGNWREKHTQTDMSVQPNLRKDSAKN